MKTQERSKVENSCKYEINLSRKIKKFKLGCL